jgi:hypothetical protein
LTGLCRHCMHPDVECVCSHSKALKKR